MSRPEAPSYYAATASPRPLRPVLDGELAVDVAIVGGGFTGLSAALELAERGYKVALLEAATVGWGASGRNGGQVNTGYRKGPAELVAMFTIGAADAFGLPVSTTHVLSSGIGGTMAANKSGLQWATVRSLLMAWVLTLPVSILLSGFLFWAFRSMV